ncbi:MAG: hypothetical protein ACXABY_12255, partial [Candidatus Thorarchaeota archaeon]
ENIIIGEMSQGASLLEIKELLNVSESLFYRLMEEDEHFSSTIKRGKRASHAWWLRNGRTQLFNKDFSPTLWYMNMKNRFGWVDKQEQTVKVDMPLSLVIHSEEKTIELKPPNKALPEGKDEF